MKIEIKKLPKSEVEIKTIIPWEKWKKFLDSAVQDISKDLKIKGFRPGKAPKEIVEQKAGRDAILNEAVKKAIQKNYPKILAEKKIEAIGAPQAEILKIAEGNDLEYKIKTAVMPKIKLSPWQEGVKKINQERKNEKANVAESEVEKELKKLAGSRAKLVTVNRAARQRDSLEINFQVSRNNVPIENGTGKKHNLILGNGAFIPGFENNLTGMKSGEEKEFELEFPKEYKSGDLAGKRAVFKVKVNLVQERTLPEIDDKFASSLGKFKNLEELKKGIKEGIKKEKVIQQKEKRRADFTEELIEKTETELPEVLIQEEIKKMAAEFKSQVRLMGMKPEAYLNQMKKTKQDLEKDWEPQAVKRIKAALALNKIAEDRDIKISSEEIEEEMNRILRQYEDRKSLEKNVDLKKLYSYAEGMLSNEKVFQLLEKL